MQDIYDKTIIEIINTAQGTQFKRNVIIPATLQHPLTGLINGVASKVNAAVAYDMSAPVNNLRESDEIDSQDGSSTMFLFKLFWKTTLWEIRGSEQTESLYGTIRLEI